MEERSGREEHVHLQDLEAFRTFTRRLARLTLLRQFCQPEHPVLRIEEDLAEMARSKLQEQILLRVPASRIRRLRPALESMIRRSAAARILSADEEDHVKESALEALEGEGFDSLFPPAPAPEPAMGGFAHA